jgi:Zn-dependent M16 (insulinase) family peptidase
LPQHLKDYQTEPSTPEELATIPLLDIKDIDPEPRKLFNRETKVEDVKLIAQHSAVNSSALFILNYLGL